MRKMKDSGIEWIGEIPEEWEVMKSRYVFRFNKGLTITRRELLEEGISCVNYGEIHSKYGFDLDLSRDSLKCADSSLLNNNQSSIVKDGDFIFCDTSEDIEGSGNCVYISNCEGQKIFAGSHTIIAKPIINMNSRYFAYLFSTNAWRAQIRSVVYGVKVFSITQNILKSIKIIMPSLETQESICSYLDKKCAEIDSIIKAKETTNEKLKEYRQSIIYEAVTKGLNKNAPMKDSGIEWIGEIPVGWETWKSRYIFEFNKGLTITRGELVEEGIPCVNYGEIHSKYGFDLDLSRDILNCADSSFINNNQSSIVKDGDFIFCDTSEDIKGSGNCVYISNSDGQKIFAGSHTIIAKPIINMNSRYFAYLFSTNAWRAQIRSVVYGVKVFSITQNILKSTKVIIPTIAEQQQIVDYLDHKCTQIDLVISANEKTIDKLKEYRQSIIYEAVTGKIEI